MPEGSELYSLYRELYSLYRELYSLYRELYSLYRELYSLYRELYSLYRELYSLYRELYSLYSVSDPPTPAPFFHGVHMVDRRNLSWCSDKGKLDPSKKDAFIRREPEGSHETLEPINPGR